MAEVSASSIGESSLSLELDREEQTLYFGEDASLDSVQERLKCEAYTEIEFNRCAKLPIESFCDLVPNVNPSLRSLVIRNTTWLNDEILELLTAFCSKIVKIQLEGCLCGITRAGIESVARNCSSLMSLCLVCAEAVDDANGETHSEDGVWTLDNRIFPALINNMTSKLRHFTLSGFSSLSGEAFEKFINNFRRCLQSLDLSELDLVDDVVLEVIGTACHHLQIVKLNHCKKVTDKGVSGLVRYSQLECLELCGCEKLTDSAIQAVARQGTKLQVIKLNWCVQLTESSLDHLSSYCRLLYHVSMAHTALTFVPWSLAFMPNLGYLDVSNCVSLFFPTPEIVENGLEAIRNVLLNTDLRRRTRCFFLGGPQTGKTSALLSLVGNVATVSDGDSSGVPVKRWFPFCKAPAVSLIGREASADESALSIELWDCSGRKALEGVHVHFMNSNTLYVITFSLGASYNSAERVLKWIATVQAKVPGALIILVASHCDLLNKSKIKTACQRLLEKIREVEDAEIADVKSELSLLKGKKGCAFAMQRIKRLQFLLANRPRIYKEVVVLSAVTGQGIDELKRAIVGNALDSDMFPVSSVDRDTHEIYARLLELRGDKLVLSWHEVLDVGRKSGIVDTTVVESALSKLDQLGCVLKLSVDDSKVVCISPDGLANAIAIIHRNDDNPQELVDKLAHKGHVDALWPTSKPNDWTLRNAFANILTNGLIREVLMPLLFKSCNIPSEHAESLIRVIESMSLLIPCPVNATYDVELIVPNCRSLSVYKQYYLPLQGKLPVIPLVNAWLSKCPLSHVQVGWRLCFSALIPPALMMSVISACNFADPNAEVLTYWQTGAYFRSGQVDVCVCQGKEQQLNLFARSKIVNGTMQATNKAWCVLSRYILKVERMLEMYPGFYYKVVAVKGDEVETRPLIQVAEEIENGKLCFPEVLFFYPWPAGRDVEGKLAFPEDCFKWYKTVSDQCLLHVSHASDLTREAKILTYFFQASGLVLTSVDPSQDIDHLALQDVSLLLLIVSSSYLAEKKLDHFLNKAWSTKSVVISLFEDLDLSAYDSRLESYPLVDISGGKGSGSIYQPDQEQVKSLVSVCEALVFGDGDVEDRRYLEVPHVDLLHEKDLRKKLSLQNSSSLAMDSEADMRHVAASAVAAAVAAATAQHIAKQSSPTMGAKAAAMAAEVADAVAKGDSDRAAKGVIAAAKAVDEVLALSRPRPSIVRQNGAPTPSAADSDTRDRSAHRRHSKSVMCVLL